MPKTYGYARISTNKQKISRQVENILAAYPNAKGNIYKETFTGKKFQGREKFDELLKKVTPGDTIVFDEVSRMSRNAEEGFATYKKLYEQNIELVFLKEPHVNTSVYREAQTKQTTELKSNTGDDITDTLINEIIAAINKYSMKVVEKQIALAFTRANDEIIFLSQRTKEGMRPALKEGRVGYPMGKKRKPTEKKLKAKKYIRSTAREFGGPHTDAETMALLKQKNLSLARNTYYAYKKEIASELLNNA